MRTAAVATASRLKQRLPGRGVADGDNRMAALKQMVQNRKDLGGEEVGLLGQLLERDTVRVGLNQLQETVGKNNHGECTRGDVDEESHEVVRWVCQDGVNSLGNWNARAQNSWNSFCDVLAHSRVIVWGGIEGMSNGRGCLDVIAVLNPKPGRYGSVI